MGTNQTIKLWEILVPTVRNDGRPIHLRFHRVWDEKVRQISGGLTIMPPIKGEWEYEASVFKERMIPVQIACNPEQMHEIGQMTLKYYEQLAVMYFKVSEEVYIIER